MGNDGVVAQETAKENLFSVIEWVMAARKFSDEALDHLGGLIDEEFSVGKFKESSGALIRCVEGCCVMWGRVIEQVACLAGKMLLGEPYNVMLSDPVTLKLEDILTVVHPERVLEAINQVQMASKQDEQFESHLFGIVSIAIVAIADFGGRWQDQVEDHIDEVFSLQVKCIN